MITALLRLVPILFLTLVLRAQVPPPPAPDINLPPPLKIKAITVESASLPGSQQVWTKVFVDYSCDQKWSDGVFFSYEVLLAEGNSYKLITGGVRYTNIPKGDNKGVMYLSPRSTARYGTPVAAHISAIFHDNEISGVDWRGPGGAGVPKDWSQMNRYQGVLVSALSTPWLVYDFEKYPDVLDIK